MGFYDIDLKDLVAEKHGLWTIEKIAGLSKFIYSFENFEKKVGRSGFLSSLHTKLDTSTRED